MSVSFKGTRRTSLDLNNGQASRILRAIGYKVTEETSGEMPIEDARKGLLSAQRLYVQRLSPITCKHVKGQPLSADEVSSLAEIADDLQYFWMLQELVDDLVRARQKRLIWF
jgi:hypothetical protein